MKECGSTFCSNVYVQRIIITDKTDFVLLADIVLNYIHKEMKFLIKLKKKLK